MKKIAVVLSGCGALDGSEIHESVLTLLAIDKAGAAYECFAPDMMQHRVMNFVTGQEIPEKRNVLLEAARIARGKIRDIREANANDFDAVIFPGGFGAALNLCDFGIKGADAKIRDDVKTFAKKFIEQKKPLGFICIAPGMIPLICGKGVTCTIGTDPQTAKTLETMGAIHEPCDVRHAVVDRDHKVVTTPAYMLGKSIGEVADGIEKLVHHVLEMTK